MVGRRGCRPGSGKLPAVLPKSFDNAPERHPSPWAAPGALRRGHALASRPWSHDVKTPQSAGCCPAAAPAYPSDMTIGASLCLIAVEAIIKYAVTANVSFIDLRTTGVILMVVGGLGLLLSLFLWASAGSRGTPPEAGPCA